MSDDRQQRRDALDRYFARASGREGVGLADYVQRMRASHGATVVDGEYRGCRCGELMCSLDFWLAWSDEHIASYEAKVQEFAAETRRSSAWRARAEVAEQRIQGAEGRAKVEAERHQPEDGGCTCGFCAWSVEHVVVMSLREALARGAAPLPKCGQCNGTGWVQKNLSIPRLQMSGQMMGPCPNGCPNQHYTINGCAPVAVPLDPQAATGVEPCGDPYSGIGCANPGCTHDGAFADAAYAAAAVVPSPPEQAARDAAYVCPQCGPDPRGSEAHTEAMHVWPPSLQPKEADK